MIKHPLPVLLPAKLEASESTDFSGMSVQGECLFQEACLCCNEVSTKSNLQVQEWREMSS